MSSFSSSVSLNSSRRPIDEPLSPGLSPLSPVTEGCKFMSETGLTLFLSESPSPPHCQPPHPAWKSRRSAISGVKASFHRRPI